MPPGRGIVCLLVAWAVAVAAPARGAELKLAHFMSANHVLHRRALVPWAEAVARATGGTVTVRLYPAGQLGFGAQAAFSRAVHGVADVTVGPLGYTSSMFPGTLLAELPGVASSARQATRMLWRGFRGPLAREFERAKVLGLWNNAPAAIMTSERPVRRLEDMAGLKIRVPSAITGRIVRSWGGSPVSMPAAQIYNALQTGVIDGVMIGASGIMPFKLYEVARYFTLGIPTSVAVFFMVANRQAWNALSAAERRAIEGVSGEAFSQAATGALLESAAIGLARVRATEGLEIIELGDRERARFRAAAETVWAQAARDLATSGASAAEILAAMSDQGEEAR